MKIIGRVVNKSSDGSLVVRSRQAHEIGSVVVNRGSERIGRISRITGPVKSPYVIVTVSRDKREDIDRLIGKDVFLQDKRDRDKGTPAKGSIGEGKRIPRGRKGQGSGRESREKRKNKSRKGNEKTGSGRVHKVKLAKRRR